MANINDHEIFIPKENGNDKAEKPIKFHIRFLTASEQSEMEYFQYVSVSGKSRPRVNMKLDSNYIFMRGVESIEGWSGGTTAEEFANARGPSWMGRMFMEVAKHIYDAMEIDEKN